MTRTLMLAALVLHAGRAFAQVTLITDVSAGFGYGTGSANAVTVSSKRLRHTGSSIDVMLSLQRAPRAGAFVAIVGAKDGGGLKDLCRFRVLGDGGCDAYALRLGSVAMLGGYRGDHGSFALRGAVGPAFYFDNDHNVAAAVQGRLHADFPANSPVALSLSGRASWLQNFRRGGYGVNAAMIGLRLRLLQAGRAR